MSLPTSESNAGRQLFEAELGTIERLIRYLRARYHLPPSEADDFASYVKLRLIEDDYAILRQFSGRSSLRSYLTVVVQRMLIDYRIGLWGKWRPSAQARREGPVAIHLERLTSRDGHSFDEACEILRTNLGVAASRAELQALAARLPSRSRREFQSDAGLEAMASGLPTVEEGAMATERSRYAARIGQTLRDAIQRLPDRDRLILKLRFEDGRTAGEVASVIGTTERAVYKRLYSLLGELRARLEADGVDQEELARVLDDPFVAMDSPQDLWELSRERPSLSEGG
jgi:RNA polymerase sigma factor for flagellar operon FliA